MNVVFVENMSRTWQNINRGRDGSLRNTTGLKQFCLTSYYLNQFKTAESDSFFKAMPPHHAIIKQRALIKLHNQHQLLVTDHLQQCFWLWFGCMESPLLMLVDGFGFYSCICYFRERSLTLSRYFRRITSNGVVSFPLQHSTMCTCVRCYSGLLPFVDECIEVVWTAGSGKLNPARYALTWGYPTELVPLVLHACLPLDGRNS